ncbi:MAG: lytic murein transglycosylase [Patescibacteria group bacterium]
MRNSDSQSVGGFGCYLIITVLFFLAGLLISFFPRFVLALTADQIQRQQNLEQQLAEVEKEIDQQTVLLSQKQKETASLRRDLAVLDYQITTAKLQIKAKQLEVSRLGSDINQKVNTIGGLNDKIAEGKVSLAEFLKKTRELDDTSVIEVALNDNGFSRLFVDLNSFNFVQEALHSSVNQIRLTKNQTETEKSQLEDKRDATANAKKVIEKETAKIQSLENQKKDLLAVSKNQESNYKKILASKKQKKAAILNALFALRDTGAIPFEKALAYAKEVSARTKVRPAFLLAIMTQETNLGENVGRCNRPGDPPAKSWKNIMKPGRDYEPFQRIVAALGLDPDTVPLSCPQGEGYGGAMGPSQFIPSTWALYEDRIAVVTGNKPPNPWNAEDAFAATGLYLEDLGAAAGTYTAESRAAGKYYAGSRWATAGKSYSASVMAIADRIQSNIDYLQSD